MCTFAAIVLCSWLLIDCYDLRISCYVYLAANLSLDELFLRLILSFDFLV